MNQRSFIPIETLYFLLSGVTAESILEKADHEIDHLSDETGLKRWQVITAMISKSDEAKS